MNFIKRAVLLSTLIISSLLIGLILCELVIRTVAPQRLAYSLEIYEADPDLVFKLRPNLDVTYSQYEFSVPIVTNSLGMRDAEPGPKNENTYRILGLGDSFSFANGVTLEETYFKQLEQCMNTGLVENNIEIINGAVPAYSLIQEINLLKKYGEKLDIDAVLLGFYTGNDFIDSMELYDENDNALIEVTDYSLHSHKDRDKEENIVRSLTGPSRAYLAVHSHLYTFVRNRTSELLSNIGLRAPIPPPEFLKKDYSPHMEKAWSVTKQLFHELDEHTRSLDLDLYVVILPAIYQGESQSWEQYVLINDIDTEMYDLDKSQRILTEFLTDLNIQVIDVLPKIQRIGEDKALFFPIDSHMNAEGHRVVADSLCNYMAPKFKNLFTYQ